MKTEFEKMRSEELTYFSDPEIQKSLIHAKAICAKLQTVSMYDAEYRPLIEKLIPGLPETSTVVPPFHCDHGNGIVIGEHTFIKPVGGINLS